MPPFRIESRLPLLAALGAIALLLSQVFTWVSVDRAADAATRGEAEALLEALFAEVDPVRGELSPELLDSFAEEHLASGVSFVRVDYPHGTWVSGEPRLPELRGRENLAVRGTLARARRRPPHGGPPAKAPDRAPPSRPAKAPDRGPPPGGRGPPPLPELAIEFEPRLGPMLQRDGRRGLLLSGGAALLFLLLAFALRRAVREREDALRDAEARRRLAALGEMSGVVAHELRNPLASLKGHAQLLVRALEEGTAPRKKAERVVAEAVRLEKLSKSLLAFVRSGDLHVEHVDVGALVESMAEEIGRERFELDVPEADVRASLDPVRIREVLGNVLHNAIQAMDAAQNDGAVTVAIVPGESLEIRVRDRGCGIDEGDEEQIFTPFHTSRTQGVGLGLAISRRIVELHGGTITAGNAPGGGAEVVIRLPRARRPTKGG